MRELLQNIYPGSPICEEMRLPGSAEKSQHWLSVDFYLPQQCKGIEIHGEQHYTYTTHFYRSKLDWAKAKLRDKKKEEWFANNEIELVILDWKESEDEWRRKITGNATSAA